MKRNKCTAFYLLLFYLFPLLFTSCGDVAVFEQQVVLPENAWAKDGVVHVTVPAPDTMNYYNLDITLRNAENYPYRNIYLFITTTAPNGTTLCDTVQYELADERGKWLGKKGRYWYDHRLLYRSQTRFIQPGDYRFGIRHGMRADHLQGIGAVGIRVE